jgi:hypothetical protein
MNFTHAISTRLTPHLHLGKHTVSTFQVCGYSGFALAFIQSFLLAARLHLSWPTMLGITAIIVVTFFSLALVTKVVRGREEIIYYHHEIAVILGTALFLQCIGKPLLPYLDITIMGIGLFLACGRIGCLMAGCCHGRPWIWGVTYREEHAQAGFPYFLVGVPLFPIQAVEAAFALGLVIAGVHAMLTGSPPGTAFSLYILVYAVGRFCFEFVRGDSIRVYGKGFSEAQWISLLAATGEVCAEHARLIPYSRWHTAVPIFLLALVVIVKLQRRWFGNARFELLHPHHVREIAMFTATLAASRDSASPAVLASGALRGTRTSRGLRVVFCTLSQNEQQLLHYSLSRDTDPLARSSAELLGKLLGLLHSAARPIAFLPRMPGVFHFFYLHNPDAPRR